MKKILLSFAALALVVSGVSAQGWSFGPKVGASFSNVNGLPYSTTRAGVVAGVFVERSVNSWFSLQTELLWNQQGFHQDMNSEVYKTNLNYLSMPVVTKYYLVSGLNLQLGAQFSYLLTAKEKGDFQYGLKNAINKYNVDALVGLAYDFNCGLVLEGRYNIGLVDVINTLPEDGQNLRTGSLQFLVGWKF